MAHAHDSCLAIVELGAFDPPKVLVIGPDPSGRLLELIGLELSGDALLIIHAMPLRRAYHSFLPHTRGR